MMLDAVENVLGFLFGAIGQEQGKLVAAQPREEVRGANAAVDVAHQFAQSLIAGEMAELVVEPFEVVEIEISERQRLPGSQRAFDGLADVFVKGASIGGAGQRIGAGELLFQEKTD